MPKFQPLVESLGVELQPSQAFMALSGLPFSFFLDSGMDPDKLGRYSFVGADPFMVVKGSLQETALRPSPCPTAFEIIHMHNDGARYPSTPTSHHDDPFTAFRDLLAPYLTEAAAIPVPFTGGAVGFFSYDLGRTVERLPTHALRDLLVPELCFGFYDVVIAFDHLINKAWIISWGFPETDETRRFQRARDRIDFAKQHLSRSQSLQGSSLTSMSRTAKQQAVSNFTRDSYMRAVERARQYIIDGDIFEVNLSQRFTAPTDIPPVELYMKLRTVNPAPFACYLGFDQVQVISASPERFLRKVGGAVETRPIKGTRRRGSSAQEDSRLASELLSSAKDHAENMMIVDLERNDLGRVCQYGSVKVTELAALETFPTVFHLTSTVQGTLMNGKDGFDLLKATFPGGSITGAPKVRAMEIIDELEPTRRSVYTGAIGYLGFDGNMDLNIAIRTILKTGSGTYFQAGGAVVYDSDPEQEYQETLDKAAALFRALNLSHPPSRD